MLGLATVSNLGLQFNGIIYSNSSMLKHNWFELAGKQGSWQIPIFYNPSDPSTVMFFDLDSVELATSIENTSNITDEMKLLYFDAINFLKERLYDSRNNL